MTNQTKERVKRAKRAKRNLIPQRILKVASHHKMKIKLKKNRKKFILLSLSVLNL